MQIYLTAKPQGERVQIPLLPDRLEVTTSAATIAANIINLGEVKIPRGVNLTGYTWDGVLPGPHMQKLKFVANWASPQSILKTLRDWQAKGTTLTLLITDLTINEDVFIESLNYEFEGGGGDIKYQIKLAKRIELTIKTATASSSSGSGSSSSSSGTSSSSSSSSKKKQYGKVRCNQASSRLNVRQKQSTSSAIIGKLTNGTKVELLAKKGNWYTIPYSKGIGKKAYVWTAYIVKV